MAKKCLESSPGKGFWVTLICHSRESGNPVIEESAIRREKQMRKWNRGWKLDLIEKQNPDWRDVWEGIL